MVAPEHGSRCNSKQVEVFNHSTDVSSARFTHPLPALPQGSSLVPQPCLFLTFLESLFLSFFLDLSRTTISMHSIRRRISINKSTMGGIFCVEADSAPVPVPVVKSSKDDTCCVPKKPAGKK